ncbi:hypothetical protein [Nostoc sp. T09]|nr:hypothetical protein [Nostoc sp. T09]
MTSKKLNRQAIQDGFALSVYFWSAYRDILNINEPPICQGYQGR